MIFFVEKIPKHGRCFLIWGMPTLVTVTSCAILFWSTLVHVKYEDVD